MADTDARLLQLLERLIGFDTTSDRSNLAIVGFVADYLAGFGVASTLVPDEAGGKAALYASIGPHVEGGVVLSAHTDVVPSAGQAWSSDPFRLTRRAGRLYGRGAADMKGFIAAVLAAVPGFVRSPLRRPVHIALSYDEEVGCLGVRPLSRHMAGRVAAPEAVIVGEPTRLRPVNAHKSGYRMVSVVTGREAHSSVPAWGVNAIVYAARLIALIERLGARLAALPGGDDRFVPPHATVSVGEIAGGTAHNIVPNFARVVWGIRGMPDTDVPALVDEIGARVEATLASEMRAAWPSCAITTEIASSILPLRPRPNSPAEALIAELSGRERMEAVSYGTDAGFFDAIGWPAVVCGPGDIAEAHKPDEFIAEAQLRACGALLERLGEKLSR